jgi:hypothetical protein
MVTSRSSFAILALFLLGVSGWTPPGIGQDQPGLDVSGSPPVQAPGAAARQSEILMLDDGRIVSGVISEEESWVIVTQPIGAMRFPKKRVEKIFGSIREVYRYKLERLAENDIDERMKLARWCLRQNMEAEAREQLGAILALSPKHPEAKAMLVSLDQTQARLTMRMRDPEVRQTAAEQVRPSDGDRPGSLDASVIQGAKRGLGISDLPVIFDLPQSQAVKRADEFARYVHPVLQTYCARCHNERFDGEFQLIQIKNKHDRTRETMRANLDATLKLIDRDNPARSELLASSLRPHGREPNTRPILQGSNDKAYQILAAWVNGLKGKKQPTGVATAHASGAGQDPGETFATHRSRISRDAGEAPASLPGATGELPLDVTVMPPIRYVQGKGLAVEGPTDPNEFPVPFTVSGKRPQIPDPVKPGTPGGAAARVGPETSSPALPPSKGQAGTLPPLPSGDDSASLAAKETTGDGTPRKSSRLKIDPSILQRALQLKNQNR